MIWCSMSRFYLSGVCLLEFWYASLVGILSWKTFSLHTDGTHLRKKLKYTVLSSYFCLFQNCLIDLLTSKGSCFKTKIKNIKCCFAKKKEKKKKKVFWTANPFFSGLKMYFYRFWYLTCRDGCFLHLMHVPLGFNLYHWLF